MTVWNYCPECGAELVISSGLPTCSNGHFTKYPTPVSCTIGLIMHEGKLLVLKRSHAPQKDCWDLPGGFVEPDETASQGLLREVREETGLDTTIRSFIGTFPSVYGDTEVRTLATSYLLDASSNQVILSPENSEYQWVEPTTVPELAFHDCRQAVTELQKHLI